MRVTDYIFKYLADYGVKHVFLVTGGGAMHLNDALKNESRIKYFCTYHEQGAAIAEKKITAPKARIQGKKERKCSAKKSGYPASWLGNMDWSVVRYWKWKLKKGNEAGT